MERRLQRRRQHAARRPANWIIDTGTSYPGGPANWGTGEIQTYTNSTANVRHDGAGNLRITPIRDGAGNWTSARIETSRTDFKPPAGGVLRIEGRIQMPNVTGAAALGYWPAFWALGAPYRGNYQNWPGIGEFDIMENVNGINSVWGVLHCGVAPGRAVQRVHRPRREPGLPRLAPASRPSTPTASSGTAPTRTPSSCAGTSTARSTTPSTRARSTRRTGRNMTSHAGYFILLNVAMGGAFPNGVAGLGTPTAAPSPGVPMLVDYVAVYTAAAAATPPTTAAADHAAAERQPGRVRARSRPRASTPRPACSRGLTPAAARTSASIGNGDWARYDGVNFGSTPAARLRRPGRLRRRRRRQRPGRGALDSLTSAADRQLRDRQHRRLADLADGPGQRRARSPARTRVYLTFTSGQPGDFVNVNWFTLPPLSPAEVESGGERGYATARAYPLRAPGGVGAGSCPRRGRLPPGRGAEPCQETAERSPHVSGQAMVQAAPLRVKAVGFGLLPVCVPLKPKLVDAPGASVPL